MLDLLLLLGALVVGLILLGVPLFTIGYLTHWRRSMRKKITGDNRVLENRP